MARITLQSKENSFILNGLEFQKGSLTVSHSENGIAINGNYANLSEITADGNVLNTIEDLKTWISNNLFKSGGGSGIGAVNSVTGNLVSGNSQNPVVSLQGLPRDIVTFDAEGNPEVKPIGITQLTDVAGFPQFSNGVFVATGISPETKTALLLFVEFSTDTPKSGTFPTYKSGGTLAVSSAVSASDAINLGQINGFISDLNESISDRVLIDGDKVLSDTNYTQAEKTKLSTIVEHYAGRFLSLSDLNNVVGNPGGYAYVSIDGAPTVLYAWNAQTSTWDSTVLAASEESPESIKTKYESNADTNAFTNNEKSRLSGMAAGSTKNDTDANLKNRENHTGTQGLETITDLITIINAINATNDSQNTAIEGKASVTHVHVIGNITGLQSALNAKVDFPTSNRHIPTRDATGLNGQLPYATTNQNGSVPVRNEVGNFQVSDPVNPTDTTNKRYVDAAAPLLISNTVANGVRFKDYSDRREYSFKHSIANHSVPANGQNTVTTTFIFPVGVTMSGADEMYVNVRSNNATVHVNVWDDTNRAVRLSFDNNWTGASVTNVSVFVKLVFYK